jgi:hypothetical protein
MSKLVSQKEFPYFFPAEFAPCETKKRLKFLYNISYINLWDCFEDAEKCTILYNPDYEALYQHYRKTGLVPYFQKLIISFVRHIDLFVDSNLSIIYVVNEALLRDWQTKTKKKPFKCI